MTLEQWLAEVRTRVAVDEGRECTRYPDSCGIPTIGIGYNLTRSDAAAALLHCGCADPHAVIAGAVALTEAQVDALFAYSFAPIVDEARASVLHFDHLSDARRFVICDLVYNLGNAGWLAFGATRALLAAAPVTADQTRAHALYCEAAEHLQSSAWYAQVGDRARRNVAMVRSGVWCAPTGDGSN